MPTESCLLRSFSCFRYDIFNHITKAIAKSYVIKVFVSGLKCVPSSMIPVSKAMDCEWTCGVHRASLLSPAYSETKAE